jgi:hypothetical protein
MYLRDSKGDKVWESENDKKGTLKQIEKKATAV